MASKKLYSLFQHLIPMFSDKIKSDQCPLLVFRHRLENPIGVLNPDTITIN